MNSAEKEMNWESLDRLDWHLWIMAIFLLLVLGVSLLGFMFPTVFWFGKDLPIAAPQRAFFAFCLLLALVLVYLMQRQSAVRRLKRKLFEAQLALRGAEQETSIQVFLALPERPQFRDALAMEFRRGSAGGTQLSAVVFQLVKGSRQQLALLVSALRTLLRRGESMYRVGERGVVIILPSTSLASAASFAAQVEQFVGIAKEDMQTRVTSYPEEVSSLRELEEKLLSEGGRLISAV